MSATTFASCSYRSARLPSANTRTGASYLRMRSTRPARWYSAPNAVFRNPSMISLSVKAFFSVRWREAMEGISAQAAGRTTPTSAAAIRTTANRQTERIVDAAVHVARQVGTPCQHLRRRRPTRPFLFRRDTVGSAPAETVAADPDAVAQRLAIGQDEVKPPLGGVDEDGAGRVVGR